MDHSNQDHTIYPYEAMFVFPQAQTANLGAAVDHVMEILNRAEAEVIAFTKWGERNLATPIANNKRGLFLLAFFHVRGAKLAGIERDANLSEMIVRFLITRADHLTEDEMRAWDGRDQLTAEIRLRSSGAAPAAPAAAAATAEPAAVGAGAEGEETA